MSGAGSEMFPIEGAAMDRLRSGLVARAEAAGLLDVAYRSIDSPLGELLLAATPLGLVRVAFAAQGVDAVLADLAVRLSPRILAAPRRLDEPARQLEEYFDRRRHAFDLALDHALSAGFRGEVHRVLPQIGYGRTTTYGELAARLGSPRAVRAVGTACATNPLPLVVPCHRVVRSDGSLGGYAGGAAAKRALLALEAAS